MSTTFRQKIRKILLIIALLTNVTLLAQTRSKAFGQVMLLDLTGEAQLLSDWIKTDNWVVLNFWATYCGPCKTEMPELEALVSKTTNTRLLLISVDKGDQRDQIDAIVAKLGLQSTVLLDSYQIAIKQYDSELRVPTTIIIKNNQIYQKLHGYNRSNIERIKTIIGANH
ncbi:MAG: TlpA family protein disulfide reductase [Leptospiraceae bacterium]|nr:TlpA family protein disulfide reductase [Leptospiraceae bacterium]